MAQNTPISGLPWPELTDIPNAQTAFQNLAVALDSVVVPRFATATARDAAITSPVDGEFAVLQDSHTPQYYNGGISRYQTLSWHVIGEQTLGNSSTTTVTFSSIPNVYKHLRLEIMGRTMEATAASLVQLRFNGDTSTNYVTFRTETNINGGSPTVAGAGSFSQSTLAFGHLAGTSQAASTCGTLTLDIPFYTETNFWQQVRGGGELTDNASTSLHTFRTNTMGAWSGTAAVTSIALGCGTFGTTAFAQNTIITLYGWG